MGEMLSKGAIRLRERIKAELDELSEIVKGKLAFLASVPDSVLIGGKFEKITYNMTTAL